MKLNWIGDADSILHPLIDEAHKYVCRITGWVDTQSNPKQCCTVKQFLNVALNQNPDALIRGVQETLLRLKTLGDVE